MKRFWLANLRAARALAQVVQVNIDFALFAVGYVGLFIATSALWGWEWALLVASVIVLVFSLVVPEWD